MSSKESGPGSAGFASPVSSTWVDARLNVNGFGRSVAHEAGFQIVAASNPVNGASLTAAVDFRPALRTSIDVDGAPLTRHMSHLARFNPTTDVRWHVDHDLASRGITHSSFALWTYVGEPILSGYETGAPTLWGGYSYGSPTLLAERPATGMFAYRGVAAMQPLFGWHQALRGNYGWITVTLDAASQTVTIHIEPTVETMYFRDVNTGVVDEGAAPLVQDGHALRAPLTCTGTYNRLDGRFSCRTGLANWDEALVEGRLQGPGGSEIAGVFRRYVRTGQYTNWGYAGAFAAKLP